MVSLDPLLLLRFMVYFSHKSLKSVRREVFCSAVLLRQLLKKVFSWILLKRFVLLVLGLVNWWAGSKLRGLSWHRHCHLTSNYPLVSIDVVCHGWFSNIVWIIRAAYSTILSRWSLLILLNSVIIVSWVLLVAMLGRSATLIKSVTLVIIPIGERTFLLITCSALAEGGQFSSPKIGRMTSL